MHSEATRIVASIRSEDNHEKDTHTVWKDGIKKNRVVDNVDNELKAHKIQLMFKKGQCEDIFRDFDVHGVLEDQEIDDVADEAGRVTVITKMKFKRKNVEIMA